MSSKARVLEILNQKEREKARKVAYLHAYFPHLHQMHLDGCDDLNALIKQAHAEETKALEGYQKRRLDNYSPEKPQQTSLRNDLRWLKV